jgi:putative thioredoxin
VRDAAAVALAAVLLDGGRADDAEAALASVDPRSAQADAAEATRRRIAFARDAAAFGGRDAASAALASDPGNLEARFALASAHAAALEWEAALAELLELVKRSRKFRDDGARKAMVAIFDHLGPQNPLVSEYRRQLQIVT